MNKELIENEVDNSDGLDASKWVNHWYVLKTFHQVPSGIVRKEGTVALGEFVYSTKESAEKAAYLCMKIHPIFHTVVEYLGAFEKS